MKPSEARVKNVSLTPMAVRIIRRIEGMSQVDIARVMDVGRQAVHFAIRGITWKEGTLS